MVHEREDRYGGFERLAAGETEGVDYRVRCEDRGSGLVVLAPHGGAIEPGTSELARAVAGDDFSFYLFEGLKPCGNRALHVTSTCFDEPRALALLNACDRAVAIHGEGSSGEIVHIGGGDEELRTHVEQCLKEYGFVTGTDRRSGLRGTSPDNLCNRCRSGAGLQLELSGGLRKRFFRSHASDGCCGRTAMFDDFVRAVRAGIERANQF